MRTRSTVLALGVAASLAGCGAAQQHTQRAQVASANCQGISATGSVSQLYGPGKVSHVEPIYRREFRARAIQPVYVAGAKLYIAAEPGMHAAFLERALSCHTASAALGHPNDPLQAAGVVDVDVTAVGPAMRIAITGANRASGKAIWQRAQALRGGPSDVSVQQLSAAPRTSSGL